MIVPATPIERVGWRVRQRGADRLRHPRAVLAELLGQADRADVHADGAVPQDELGRAAADVHDHQHAVQVARPSVAPGEGEPRLLLAREQPRVKP
jgi:hypothetical protein